MALQQLAACFDELASGLVRGLSVPQVVSARLPFHQDEHWFITSEFPEVSVIGLSMHEKEDMGAAMRDAGAYAYFPKGGPSEPLIAAIEHARESHK